MRTVSPDGERPVRGHRDRLYYWRVQYSGDLYNNGFNTACGAEVTQIQEKDDTPRDNLITLP